MSGARDGVCYTTLDEIMLKNHCSDVFMSLRGLCKAFVMGNGSIDVFDCSWQYQLMPNESIDANYQVVEVSFNQTLVQHNIKKSPSDGTGNGEYLLWQGISYQNYDTNSPNGTFLCSAHSSFLYHWLWNKKWWAAKHTNPLPKKSHRRIGLPGTVGSHLDKYQLLGG